MLGAVDPQTSKTCTERQLALSDQLHDHAGKEDAFLQLGGLAQAVGDFGEAKEYFSKAFGV